MTVIRSEQMQVFYDNARADFEARMFETLRRIAPQKCDLLGDEELRRIVGKGTDRAMEYGMRIERGIAHYIVLMLLVCEDFDTDPASPWAAPVLTDAGLREEEKILKLQFAAKRFGFMLADLK